LVVALRRVQYSKFCVVGQRFTHFRNGEDNLLHRSIVTDNFYLRCDWRSTAKQHRR
jgi:hypothetical protein